MDIGGGNFRYIAAVLYTVEVVVVVVVVVVGVDVVEVVVYVEGGREEV